jgi:hypothetical protein
MADLYYRLFWEFYSLEHDLLYVIYQVDWFQEAMAGIH